MGDKWKDKTLKYAMRQCFRVEHTILSAKWKPEDKARMATISPRRIKALTLALDILQLASFSPCMLWARFSLKGSTQFSNMGR